MQLLLAVSMCWHDVPIETTNINVQACRILGKLCMPDFCAQLRYLFTGRPLFRQMQH